MGSGIQGGAGGTRCVGVQDRAGGTRCVYVDPAGSPAALYLPVPRRITPALTPAPSPPLQVEPGGCPAPHPHAGCRPGSGRAQAAVGAVGSPAAQEGLSAGGRFLQGSWRTGGSMGQGSTGAARAPARAGQGIPWRWQQGLPAGLQWCAGSSRALSVAVSVGTQEVVLGWVGEWVGGKCMKSAGQDATPRGRGAVAGNGQAMVGDGMRWVEAKDGSRSQNGRRWNTVSSVSSVHLPLSVMASWPQALEALTHPHPPHRTTTTTPPDRLPAPTAPTSPPAPISGASHGATGPKPAPVAYHLSSGKYRLCPARWSMT